MERHDIISAFNAQKETAREALALYATSIDCVTKLVGELRDAGIKVSLELQPLTNLAVAKMAKAHEGMTGISGILIIHNSHHMIGLARQERKKDCRVLYMSATDIRSGHMNYQRYNLENEKDIERFKNRILYIAARAQVIHEHITHAPRLQTTQPTRLIKRIKPE